MKYLLLEWIGRWSIPDHLHGGVKPGPYDTEAEAFEAITAFVAHQRRGYEGYGENEAFIDEECALLVRRHRIVPIEWPTEPPPGEAA